MYRQVLIETHLEAVSPLDRASLIICEAPCKMKMWGLEEEQVQATVKLLSLGSSASAGPGTLEVADRCCLEPLPALSGELEH